MELQEIRKKLDEIDSKLLPLLEERMACSKFVGEYKKSRGIPILDSKREGEILQKIRDSTKSAELKDYTEEIYKEIMRVSREYQAQIIDK